jgi:hypothetical protein
MNKQNTLNPMYELENKSIEELQAYNEALEQSPEYQRILLEVMNDVYSQYVKEEIERSERYLEKEDAEEDDDVFASLYRSHRESVEKKLNEAKMLMPENPEQAAQVFMQLGSCHRIWAIQKQILREKHGITWYTPAELHPEIKFD